MDLSTNEKEAGSVDPTNRESSDTASDSGGGGLKICADCQTTKTPLWRAGPNGPKSLCNACGIRFRKRRRKEGEGEGEGLGMVEKLRRQRSPWGAVSRRRRKEKNWSRILGEEEERAALLLMALSTKPFL